MTTFNPRSDDPDWPLHEAYLLNLEAHRRFQAELEMSVARSIFAALGMDVDQFMLDCRASYEVYQRQRVLDLYDRFL